MNNIKVAGRNFLFATFFVSSLCLLGMATKEMMILTPDPAIWVSLPGGMPYFRVEKEKQTDMSSVY